MNNNRSWFAERMKPFVEKGFQLRVCSYRLRREDGTPGCWKAQVHVFHHEFRQSTVLPLLEAGRKTHSTALEANRTAYLMGLGWLERNA
jgi:hypothetical protein